jgi:hypothetical protein
MALELGEIYGRASFGPPQPGRRCDLVRDECCPYRRATELVRFRVHIGSASYSFICLSRAEASNRTAPVHLSR